jgi:hypothetical protein
LQVADCESTIADCVAIADCIGDLSIADRGRNQHPQSALDKPQSAIVNRQSAIRIAL